MHFGILIISWVIGAKVFGDLIFDDQSYYNFNLNLGTDSSSDSIFGLNSDLSPFDGANGPFDESVDYEDGEDWNLMPATNEDSGDYLADASSECSLELGAVSKSRKSRRTECEAHDSVKDLPPGFSDLSNDLQDQLYRRWVCPSKSPGESLVPVCSSRLPQNNHLEEQINYPGVWSYTLMDSFVRTSIRDRILFLIWQIFWKVALNNLGECSSPREPFCCKSWSTYTFFKDDGSSFKIVRFLESDDFRPCSLW